MTTTRPSAKQAIEVLKIHQLRKENAVIFEEVKGLREDVERRRSDLDEARKDTSKLTDEVKKLQKIVCDYGPRLAQLDNGSLGCADKLKELQDSHRSLGKELSKTNSAFDTTILQNQSTIKEFAEEVTGLKNQITTCEETHAISVNELRNDLAGRAETNFVAELEDKLEGFVQEIDARFESLQKVSHISDSFDSPRNQQSGDCDHPCNASSLTATVPSRFTNEHDSNRGRWVPIETQAALRATPPAMPETLVPPRARDDEEVRTPSTLRSTVLARDLISNIIHTQPLIEHVPVKAPRLLDPPVSFQTAQRQAPAAVEPLRQHAMTDWEALDEVLRLRQRESETLTEYLARFQAITTRFPGDCDIVSVILKRLVVGMRQDQEKQFVQEWLITSDWTLENVRDCMLLLTRCKDRVSNDHIDSGSHELGETAAMLAQICNGDHDFHQSGPPTPRVGQSLSTSLSPGRQFGKQQNLPQQIELQTQRIQPARAAKAHRRGNVDEDKRNRSRNVNVVHRVKDTNGQQNKMGEGMANTESALTTGANVTADPTGIQQKVTINKRDVKSRMERELKSLANTKPIEKSKKGPTKPQKRKALHQPDEDLQPVGQPEQDPVSPLAKRRIKSKRIPTLVARGAAKALSVPETSDGLELPPISTGPENGRGRGNGEGRSGGQKSALLMLTLSTSDFD